MKSLTFDFRQELIDKGLVENNKWNAQKARWQNDLSSRLLAAYETLTGQSAQTVSEAGYFFYNNLSCHPSCKLCQRPVHSYQSFSEGFRAYCSVKCAKSDPAIIASTRATNRNRYGCGNVSNHETVKQKRSETIKKRFGAEHYFQSHDAKAKAKQTHLKTRGVEHPMHCEEVVKKQKATVHERYGDQFGYFPQRNITAFGREHLADATKFADVLLQHGVATMAELCGVSPQTIYAYCKQHGLPRPRSRYEQEIGSWLDEQGLNYRSNVKLDKLEIDFVIEGKIGLEFNGLYYHTTASLAARGIELPKDYHASKLKVCEENGLRLFMINEDEWLERSDAIKARLLNLCRRSSKGAGARKLRIGSIDLKCSNAFVDKHHIQGSTASTIANYGAFDADDRLVAVMQFSHQRGTKAVELIRFCSDGRVYPGVFTRMLKHAVENEGYQSVISFADLRHSRGDVYSSNGFIEVGRIPPDYRYAKGLKTFHKSSFRKSEIARRFGEPYSMMTEAEAMRNLGYDRIYDCGKIKYKWCLDTNEGDSTI